MRAVGGLLISLQLVRERHASSHPPLRVGVQDERHDLHTHVLPADIAWQLPGDITATLSSAGYRTGGLLLAGRKFPRCFSLIPRVVSERSWQCICCDWYTLVSCGDPSVHPWSAPLDVNQAINKVPESGLSIGSGVLLYEQLMRPVANYASLSGAPLPASASRTCWCYSKVTNVW
jgi:hypothetical protein